jgi:hypothetical protein
VKKARKSHKIVAGKFMGRDSLRMTRNVRGQYSDVTREKCEDAH